jgi:acyl-CoA dehydrogenase
MEFALSEEHRMLKDLIARFVREELIPLERVVLERDGCGHGRTLTPEERAPIDKKSRELGLWGLDAPEDVGGSDLPQVALVGVNE